jgi:hypothetical protein
VENSSRKKQIKSQAETLAQCSSSSSSTKTSATRPFGLYRASAPRGVTLAGTATKGKLKPNRSLGRAGCRKQMNVKEEQNESERITGTP